ncbi:MAG: NAD(P)H-hydrate dehydratase, partial [Chloroflexota bacterium]
EMRALEAAAIEAGTPERVLQERAGLAVADIIEAELASRPADGWTGRSARILALAGAGNNGRDAVVAGRRLRARGCAVEIWHGSRNPLSTTELEDIAGEGIRIHRYDRDQDAPHLDAVLAAADIVIDGLLGVGSRGPMRPEQARVAGALNLARGRTGGPQVVAVDVPSGIDADDGSVPGVAVYADITVTFGAVKAGLLRFPAATHGGRLVVGRIGLRAGHADGFTAQILDAERVRRSVPHRAADAHKYRVGRVLVVAGSDQYVGAACLGSEAAARAGAGLIGLVSTEAVKHVLATRLPEATYPLTLTDMEARPEAAAEAVAALLPDQNALLVGPGIGRSESTERFLRSLLSFNARQTQRVPAVIDADALSLLADWPRWWEQIGPGNILTPHAGEMARLLTSDPDLGDAKDEPPWETARRTAERWSQVIVLKGPFTCVAAADDTTWIYPHANPALATAGTGDVLAGLTAGLVAQGLSGVAAAQLAVVTHAEAARRVTARFRGATLLASDLPQVVPGVLAALGSGHSAV